MLRGNCAGAYFHSGSFKENERAGIGYPEGGGVQSRIVVLQKVAGQVAQQSQTGLGQTKLEFVPYSCCGKGAGQSIDALLTAEGAYLRGKFLYAA